MNPAYDPRGYPLFLNAAGEVQIWEGPIPEGWRRLYVSDMPTPTECCAGLDGGGHTPLCEAAGPWPQPKVATRREAP